MNIYAAIREGALCFAFRLGCVRFGARGHEIEATNIYALRVSTDNRRTCK